MPEFLKKFIDNKGKKGVQNLILMLLAGVTLLAASAYFANTTGGDGLFVSSQDLPQEVNDDYTYDQGAYIPEVRSLTEELEEILSLVAGAGQVRVMITLGNAESIFAHNTQQNVSATIEEDGEGGTRNVESVNASITYVMVRQNDGSEVPLMLQEIRPAIEGIIIVAQGGGDPHVASALTRAAQAVLGVPAHRVQVFEMR